MVSADSRSGFTLVEVTAVMLIIALVASLAVTMGVGTGRVGLKSLAMQAASLIRQERLGAVLTGQDRVVVLDRNQRILSGGHGEAVAIPKDVIVDVLGPEGSQAGLITVVQFRANGASSGGVLRLSRERVSYELRINWYTGAVAIAEATP